MLIKAPSSPSEFSEYSIQNIKAFGADLAIYWYEYEGYEGSGYILMKKGLKWYINDCSHCSCYGPTEHINDATSYNSIEELKKETFFGYRSEHIATLINLIPDSFLRREKWQNTEKTG